MAIAIFNPADLPRRQRGNIDSLLTPRMDWHVFARVEVEMLNSGTMMISRWYGPANYPDMYFDVHTVGPRGGVKLRARRAY